MEDRRELLSVGDTVSKNQVASHRSEGRPFHPARVMRGGRHADVIPPVDQGGVSPELVGEDAFSLQVEDVVEAFGPERSGPKVAPRDAWEGRTERASCH